MPELRKDPITREWVVIAVERARRPSDFVIAATDEGSVPAGCPFCPGNESLTPPEILAFRDPASQRNGAGWWVRVIPNKFPALAIEGNLNKAGHGMYDSMNGVGAHEVIIETPQHDVCLATTSTRQVEDVLWAYRQRYLDLKQDPRLKFILFFRNHGRVAGASLAHPHSQLIATPVIPRDIFDEMEGARRYEQYRDRCVYCDIIQQELDEGSRIVAENSDFIAFEPYASKYPFETWVMPRKHGPSFAHILPQEQTAFASILHESLLRIRLRLGNPPYNYTLHTAPCDEDQSALYHWHLEIFPRLTVAAGFEMGTGIYINVTPPEQAAAYLREVELTPEAASTGEDSDAVGAPR
jgi:UDPglucose--hexose-1-phosphate uridylyltransferase